jgi:phosphate starvation-inducible protein PhoH
MATKRQQAAAESQETVKQPSNALKIRLDHMKTFQPLTDNQKLFFDAYKRGDYFIALHGVAGTGKTFIALYKALEEVLDKANPFNKIIIVRSAVPSREVGHLPGDIDEKTEIYRQPYQQICDTLFGRTDAYQRLEEQGHIDFISTSFIRGMSFDDAIILVDECQNCNYPELQTVITRVGHRSKIIFCGDYRQTDLNRNKNDISGIKKFLEIASTMTCHTRIEFTADDIVRSSLVRDWIIAEAAYDDKEYMRNNLPKS